MRAAVFRILALIRKELLAVLQDPLNRVTLFGPVIAQCIVFGYAATYDLTRIPYVVLDRDDGPASRAFIAQLDGSGVFERVAKLHDLAAMKAAIDRRQALIAIQIGEDFDRTLNLRRPPQVQVIADGRNSNTASTATLYVSQIAAGFSHSGQYAPVLSYRYWYNPNAESRWHFVPGMIATLSMLQILLLCSMSIAREREQGTFDQLLVTPMRPFEIMAGKAIPAVLIGLVEGTLVLLIALFWFRVPMNGSVVTLYISLAIFLLAIIGIGLVLSSLARTMQQAMLYTFLVMMPFVLFSGLTTPISAMPPTLRALTFIDPLRYAVDAFGTIMLKGEGLTAVWPDLWPLALISALTLSVATAMFRRNLR